MEIWRDRCVHEGTHAALAELLNGLIMGIEIGDDGGSVSVVMPDKRSEALVALGGVIADLALRRLNPLNPAPMVGHQDLIAAQVYEPNREKLIMLQAEALILLWNNKPTWDKWIHRMRDLYADGTARPGMVHIGGPQPEPAADPSPGGSVH